MEKQVVLEVGLAPRKVKLTVSRLNQVLDDERIYGQEWNKQVIKELILENLTKDTTIDLIKELEELPISEWND